jgi:hypothetical protein
VRRGPVLAAAEDVESSQAAGTSVHGEGKQHAAGYGRHRYAERLSVHRDHPLENPGAVAGTRTIAPETPFRYCLDG